MEISCSKGLTLNCGHTDCISNEEPAKMKAKTISIAALISLVHARRFLFSLLGTQTILELFYVDP